MTEIITTTISSPSEMEAKGMQVLYRCKDCDYYKPCDHPQVIGLICHRLSEFEWDGMMQQLIGPYFTEPTDYCSWATPRA